MRTPDRSAARRRLSAVSTLWLGLACTPSPCARSSASPETRLPRRHYDRLPFGENETEALRALGYLDVVDAKLEGVATGLLSSDRERTAPGLTYFTSAGSCSSHVVDVGGAVLASWRHAPCHRWGNSVLLPTGEVLAVHTYPPAGPDIIADTESRALVKLDRHGALVWERRLPTHHDVEVTPSGTIATLTFRLRVFPEVHATVPVRDHLITLLDADGQLLEEVSLAEVLLADAARSPPKKVTPARKEGLMQIDLLHTNTVEWMRWPALASRHPLYAPGNVLVCLRSQDLVAVIDWRARRLVWSWGRGVLSGPHDASIRENGNLLLFDNGLARRRSRVLEVDPLTEQIVARYEPTEPEAFFTRTRGSAQRLTNDNLLVTDSEAATLLEVTPAGEVVWTYRNPEGRGRRPYVVVRARRYLPRSDAPVGFLPTAAVD